MRTRPLAHIRRRPGPGGDGDDAAHRMSVGPQIGLARTIEQIDPVPQRRQPGPAEIGQVDPEQPCQPPRVRT